MPAKTVGGASLGTALPTVAVSGTVKARIHVTHVKHCKHGHHASGLVDEGFCKADAMTYSNLWTLLCLPQLSH